MLYSDWIKRGVAKKGKSVIGLGKVLGKTRGTIYKMINNEIRIQASDLEAIALYLEEPPPIGMTDSGYGLVSIPVERKIGAGIWFENVGTKTSDTITVARDTEFPKAKQIAYRWEGDSMDAIAIMSGDIIVCLDFKDFGSAVADGQLVIIERNRAGVLELSLKVVSIHDDIVEYRPMSKNPAYKPVVQHKSRKSTGVETVTVVGVVRKIERIVRCMA